MSNGLVPLRIPVDPLDHTVLYTPLSVLAQLQHTTVRHGESRLLKIGGGAEPLQSRLIVGSLASGDLPGVVDGVQLVGRIFFGN